MEILGNPHEIQVFDTSIIWGEMGSGEPLVLLHGLYDSHRTWRRAAPLLAENFRVLMPDLPGHGWSGRPDAPYTLDWYARILAVWMDAIGLESAHICGHSLGGGIASWMLLQERSKVNRLALVSTGGMGREVAMQLRLAAFPLLGQLLTPLVMYIVVPIMLKYKPELFGHVEPEEADIMIRMCRIRGSSRAFHRSLKSVINLFGQYMQTLSRAHEINALPPIALFWGMNDPIIPMKHGKSALVQSTGITLTLYPECGHYPQLEVMPRFALDLKEFLLDPSRPAAHLLLEPKSQSDENVSVR
jgi:pimeloyl-ACP methyl ester carboxylesterase